MAKIGYIRISISKNKAKEEAKQLEYLDLDKIYEEKVGATQVERSAFRECLKELQSGDVLFVQSIDRIARNVGDLQRIVTKLSEKNVTLCFVDEKINFKPLRKPQMEQGSLLAHQPKDYKAAKNEQRHYLLDVLAHFEKSLVRERQQEGIEKAISEGKLLGRPRKINAQDKKDIIEAYKQGKPATLIASEYGVSLSLIYKLKANTKD